jgi:uncharacterized protein YacL
VADNRASNAIKNPKMSIAMGPKTLPIRLFFILLAVTAFAICFSALWDSSIYSIALGACTGAIVAGLFMLIEKLCSGISLRKTLIICFGLSMGYLTSQQILSLVASSWQQIPEAKVFILFFELACIYLSILSIEWLLGRLEAKAASSASQIHAVKVRREEAPAIPSRREKLVLADVSALSDPRMIDLAASGILDDRLLIARATINELYTQAEYDEEMVKIRARRALDAIKKLEVMAPLGLQYTDFTPIACSDPYSYIVSIARESHASILTTDINRLQQNSFENIRIINLNELANALKPIMQAGEVIAIKVQRYGKEPRQGVGYLEDGTMVVINGGASYIGEVIQAHVLSVKHSTTGARMIFCNAIEDNSDAMLPGSSKTFASIAQRPAGFCTP